MLLFEDDMSGRFCFGMAVLRLLTADDSNPATLTHSPSNHPSYQPRIAESPRCISAKDSRVTQAYISQG